MRQFPSMRAAGCGGRNRVGPERTQSSEGTATRAGAVILSSTAATRRCRSGAPERAWPFFRPDASSRLGCRKRQRTHQLTDNPLERVSARVVRRPIRRVVHHEAAPTRTDRPAQP